MSDEIIVMNNGKIQQKGSPIDIYNEPKNAFVASFIGESNIIDGVMKEDFLVDFAGAGATVPLTGFGYTLARGTAKAVGEQGTPRLTFKSGTDDDQIHAYAVTTHNADGKIVETGNHASLLAQGGFYATLYNSQFEGAPQ